MRRQDIVKQLATDALMAGVRDTEESVIGFLTDRKGIEKPRLSKAVCSTMKALLSDDKFREEVLLPLWNQQADMNRKYG